MLDINRSKSICNTHSRYKKIAHLNCLHLEKITILTIEDKKEYAAWTSSIKDSIQNYNKKTNIRESSYTFTDGTVYKGQWEDAKMHGKGQLLFSNGKYIELD